MDAIAAMKTLAPFIGHSQMHCLADLCRSEEKQFFFDKLCELAALVTAMPQTYDQEGLGDAAIVSLHYFTGGCDWFITEKDKETPDEPGQHQAFGYANLGDPQNAELGYISIVELLANGAELDLYFKPRPLAECKTTPYRRLGQSAADPEPSVPFVPSVPSNPNLKTKEDPIMLNKPVVIEMPKDKDCKHSIRFGTPDDKAAVSNVYVNRSMPGIEQASKVRVTIEILN